MEYTFRIYILLYIQPHFDYACSAWYTNLTQKLKKKLEVMQNKCIFVCLQYLIKNLKIEIVVTSH